jgi:membrane-bound lytic murein transglycosylase F
MARNGSSPRCLRWSLPLLLLPVLLQGAACGPDVGEGDSAEGAGYIESGDLQALRERGYLRILMPPHQPLTLPRRGYTIDQDLELAEELAKSLGLEPKVVTIRSRSELLQALLEGRGDVVLARLTATPERRERFLFSVPLDHVREMLVVRKDREGVLGRADLSGMEIAVRKSSSFYVTLQKLLRQVPDLEIVPVGEELDTEEILYKVANGVYDATVADEDLLREVTTYLHGIRAAFPLTPPRPIAWALRPDGRELKEAVDAFLHRKALNRGLTEVALGDLGAIRERRVLRVLTRNNAVSYFLYRGRQMGFEFELAREFADSIGCRLQIVVPPRGELLIPWLREGRGDMIAAALTVTEERQGQVSFSRPYNRVSEMLVVHEDEEAIDGIEDLAGRSVTVRVSSSYHDTLVAHRGSVEFEIHEAPEDLETEELIRLVGEGVYEATVADSNILDIELAYRDEVKGAFPLGEPRDIAWAVRREDEKLLEAVNGFLEREYRGTFFNVLLDKYFVNRGRIARVMRSRSDRQGRISPFDELFRKHAREVEIDWRLLAAVAYQESRFLPDAVSWNGAVGLMQVMPITAEELGYCGDLMDPETAIAAGARYLRWLIDRFEPSLEFEERVRFSLAAYNAGRGHILDGRRLARESGLDPNIWFDNVEKALPLLSKSRYADGSRYGYCRCTEPVRYVRQVNDRYLAYTRILE